MRFDRRDLRCTGTPAARIASLIPGTARIGSMLMKGFDGQTTTHRSDSPASASGTGIHLFEYARRGTNSRHG